MKSTLLGWRKSTKSTRLSLGEIIWSFPFMILGLCLIVCIYFRSNLIELDIFYKDFSSQRTEQSVEYTLSSFFSEYSLVLHLYYTSFLTHLLCQNCSESLGFDTVLWINNVVPLWSLQSPWHSKSAFMIYPHLTVPITNMLAGLLLNLTWFDFQAAPAFPQPLVFLQSKSLCNWWVHHAIDVTNHGICF